MTESEEKIRDIINQTKKTYECSFQEFMTVIHHYGFHVENLKEYIDDGLNRTKVVINNPNKSKSFEEDRFSRQEVFGSLLVNMIENEEIDEDMKINLNIPSRCSKCGNTTLQYKGREGGAFPKKAVCYECMTEYEVKCNLDDTKLELKD